MLLLIRRGCRQVDLPDLATLCFPSCPGDGDNNEQSRAVVGYQMRQGVSMKYEQERLALSENCKSKTGGRGMPEAANDLRIDSDVRSGVLQHA